MPKIRRSDPYFIAGKIRKPKSVTNKYDKETVLKAIEDVHSGVYKTQREAAIAIGVPYTTFSAYYKDPSKITKIGGPKCILSIEQEKGIAEAVIWLAEVGFGNTIQEIRSAAYHLALNSGGTSFKPNVNQLASEDWSWTYDIAETDIWNIDETFLSLLVKNKKVVCGRSSNSVNKMSNLYGELGKHVTGVCFIKADGESSPPSFIFPGKEISHQNLKGCKDFNKDSLCFASDKGWINNNIFYHLLKKWILDVLPAASERSTLLLLMDGHGSHTTLQKLMGSLLPVHKNGIQIHEIPVLLKLIFAEAFSKGTIIKAFKKAGIAPLRGLEAVDERLLLPSESLSQLAGYGEANTSLFYGWQLAIDNKIQEEVDRRKKNERAAMCFENFDENTCYPTSAESL
eukprot:Awhi_evm1s2736